MSHLHWCSYRKSVSKHCCKVKTYLPLIWRSLSFHRELHFDNFTDYFTNGWVEVVFNLVFSFSLDCLSNIRPLVSHHSVSLTDLNFLKTPPIDAFRGTFIHFELLYHWKSYHLRAWLHTGIRVHHQKIKNRCLLREWIKLIMRSFLYAIHRLEHQTINNYGFSIGFNL